MGKKFVFIKHFRVFLFKKITNQFKIRWATEFTQITIYTGI